MRSKGFISSTGFGFLNCFQVAAQMRESKGQRGGDMGNWYFVFLTMKDHETK